MNRLAPDIESCHGEGLDGSIFAEVHRQYTVHCAGCPAQEIEWMETKRDAVASFRGMGWCIRGGLWFCRGCVDYAERRHGRRGDG